MSNDFSVLLWVGWNLFLAAIPVGLAYSIAFLLRGNRGKSPVYITLSLVLGLVWLLFLPNTCYLLTEWRHFFSTIERAQLYTRWAHGGNDTAMLLLLQYTLFFSIYSALGMLAFTLAIRPIARIFREHGATLWVWGIPLFTLVSIGVYLGLILRFNSWDILNQLHDIWTATVAMLSRPYPLMITFAFGGFLWLAYLVVDTWIDGVLLRWERRKQV